MYLSRIMLDAANRKVMEGFVRPSVFHGAVERSVGTERQRNLWRIDPFRDSYCLLLVTPVEPDLSGFAEQFGLWGELPETKNYDAFLGALKAGQRWRFRVKLNPIKCVDGKRCPVMNRDLKAWFSVKAEANGFEIRQDDFDICELRDYCFNKSGEAFARQSGMVRFKTATFEGILTVTEPDALRQALSFGIGKEKAYGCGLLTLARL